MVHEAESPRSPPKGSLEGGCPSAGRRCHYVPNPKGDVQRLALCLTATDTAYDCVNQKKGYLKSQFLGWCPGRLGAVCALGTEEQKSPKVFQAETGRPVDTGRPAFLFRDEAKLVESNLFSIRQRTDQDPGEEELR